MKLTALIIMLLIAGEVMFTGCNRKSRPSGGKNNETKNEIPSSMAKPPCIIYKTSTDYSQNVPVILSADKSEIVSFPDVTDIRKQGDNVYPDTLAGGFLLDNRGIGPDVAFLDLTYSEFSAMDKTPDAGTLFGRIIDKEPLVEMYRCGSRYDYKDIVPELNTIISSGKLSGCTRIK